MAEDNASTSEKELVAPGSPGEDEVNREMQVGASEAAYRVNPHLRMKDSNIGCLFVMNGFPQNRSVLYRQVKDDQEI